MIPFLAGKKKASPVKGKCVIWTSWGQRAGALIGKFPPRLKAKEEGRKILFLSESVDADSGMRTAEAVKDLDRRLQAYFEARTRFFVLDATQMAKRT